MRTQAPLILVRPEDFLPTSSWKPDQHVYVRVLRTRPDHAVVQALRDSSRQGQVRLNALQDRLVTEDDANTATGELLRKAVCGVVRGTYVYGQVQTYQGKSVNVRHGDSVSRMAASRLDEIAPVTCLLVQNSAIKTADTTRAALRDFNATVLDRVLGNDGSVGSRDVVAILNGVLPRNQQPDESELRTWIDPATGKMATFSLQHAVDYAYYVDGNRPVPTTRQLSLGTSFTDDPAYRDAVAQDGNAQDPGDQLPTRRSVPRFDDRTRTRTRNQSRTRTRDSSLPFDPIASPNENSTLTALLSELEGDDAVVDDAVENVLERPMPPSSSGSSRELQSELLSTLAANPRALAYFISEYLDRNKRPAESIEINSRPTQRRALGVEPAMSSAIDTLERSQAGTNFRPTSLQQAVHGLIVHPDYAGKTPSEIMQLMLSSSAAGITPHPAILMKLFDFAFGVRGLSLAHLEWFDLAAQRKWRRQGVNMNNFAASVDLPCSRCLTTMSELFEAKQAFALKFYNAATQEFITAAMSFAATITGMGLCNASAVDLITFWFDGVLDEYRRAVEDLVVSGIDNRGRVRQRLAKNDPDFINNIHLVHTEANATALKEPVRQDRTVTRRSGSDSKRSRVPQDVLEALPLQNGKSVCLKFLSRSGCSPRSPERCSYGRAHFVPEKLEPVVRQYIIESMGGLRRDIPQDQ